MNLGVFNYLKNLSGFNDHKPIIALSADVYENYYNYYIVNGLMFVVGVQQVQDLDTPAVYTLTLINPDEVEAVYIDEDLNADVTKATNISAGDYDAAVKAIMTGLASGSNNHGIPYSSATANFCDRVVKINDSFKAGNEIFSVVNTHYDAAKFANTGSQGEVYGKCMVIGNYHKVSSVSIPLNAVMYTPFKDYCGDEILELCKNYMKNLKIDGGVPMIKGRSYHKGEHVRVDVENSDGTKTTKYFISKIEGNPAMSALPTDDSAWIDITSEVTGA